VTACRHTYRPDPEHEGYEQCCACGTAHSTVASAPLDIYTPDYWTHERGNSTLTEQVFNCNEYTENGVTKNDFVLRLIEVPSRRAALEIGCAPGVLLGRLKREAGFAIVDGVEVPSAWDDEIRANAGSRVDLWHGVFPHQPAQLSAGWYDLIIGLDVFEHSHHPEEFLAECARLTRKDGQLILMMPLLGDELPERFWHPEQHVYIHDGLNLRVMLHDAGYKQVRIETWTAGHEVVSARRTD
jgi:SAM-dependent methyltransferase